MRTFLQKSIFISFLTLLFLVNSQEVIAQTTYTWIATSGSASFATAGSWNPTRTTPATNDILQFSNGGTPTVTNVPIQTIGQLLVSGNTNVTFTAPTPNSTYIITIAGLTGVDLSVASGCQLNIAGTRDQGIALLTGATGSITGNMTFTNSAHTLTAADASGITFNSPAVFTAGTNFTGNAFGTTGTNNTVVFATGSTYVSAAGANPFGNTAPNSKVQFQTGSLFRITQNAAPAMNGRTYANFEVNGATFSQSPTGTSGVTMDNLTITNGTLNLNTTGVNAVTIKGNISVASGKTLTFSPASASTLTFSGTTAQTISNSGTLTFSANEAVVIANTASPTPSVTFNNAQTISGSTTVNSGSILATSATLTLAGTPAINGSFQINQNGFATGGTWNYGSGATLIFNNSSGQFGIQSTHVYWPATNGPTNVNISGAGGINLGSNATTNRTVSGIFQTSGPVALSNSTVLTLNGTAQLNNGGSFSNAPTYGSSSTLVYNTGTTYGRSNEWNATSGAGYPNNVTINSGSSLDLGNGGTGTARQIAGNLVLDGSLFMDFGANDMTQALTVLGNLTIGTTGTLSLSDVSGGDLKLYGNWTRTGSGTFNPKGRAVFFQGGNSQTFDGTTTFDYLSMGKSANDLTVNTGNIAINLSLVFSDSTNGGSANGGKIITGVNNVIFNGAGATSGASTTSYVFGNVLKTITSGASAPSFNFPIGDTSVYAPVNLNFTGTTTATGSITAFTLATDDPNIATSTIDETQNVNRYWSMVNSGITGFTDYNATFNFVAGDIDSGANTSNFIVGKYDPSSWAYPTVGTKTSTSTQATGMTSFSTFAVGQGGAAAPTINTQPSASTVCNPSGTSFTALANSTPPSTVIWEFSTNGGGSYGTLTISGVYSVNTTSSSGITTSVLTISNSSGLSGNLYRAKFTNTKGNVTSNGALLTVNIPSVAPTSISGTTTICNGDSTTLTVVGGTLGTGANYQWGTGAVVGTSPLSGETASTLNISPSSTTTYWLRIENTTGPCSANTTGVTQAVTVNQPSVAPTSISGTTTICNGDSTTLTAVGGTLGTGANYQWGTGAVVGTSPLSGETASTLTISPSSSTTYWVRIESTTSPCTANTSGVTQAVTVNQPSVAPTSISGTTTICNGDSTTLTAVGGTLGTGANYQWGTGAVVGTSPLSGETASTLTISPSSTTTYWVRIENTTGPCTTTTSGVTQAVTVNQPSVAPTSITGTTTICNGDSTTLTAVGGTLGTGANYQWGTGAVVGTSPLSGETASTLNISPSSTTTYWVRIENTTGPCSANTTGVTQAVTVNQPSVAPTSITGTTTICNGDSTTLTAVGGTLGTGANYQWGTGAVVGTSPLSGETASTLTISPSSTTTYWVRIETTTSPCTANTTGVTQAVTVSNANTWTGGASTTAWATPGNWSCGIVPISATDVTISTASFYPEISSNVSINSLTLDSGTTLKVNPTYDLTVTDVIDNDGTLTIENNANLLQTNNVSNTGSGATTVKRNSSALLRLDYTLWSSPVSGQGLYAFSPFTFANRFYVYRTTTNLYNNADVGFSITGLNGNGVNGTDGPPAVQFTTAKGYLIRVPWNHPAATPTVWNGTFTGVPNNGNITYIMTSGASGFRFNLVGNPYPSPISMSQFVFDNSTKITGTLYFWRETNNSTANNAYCSWAGGTFVTNSEAQVFDPSGIIRTGQGFIVEAQASQTVLSFNNGQRSSDNTDQFFKNNSVVNSTDTVETNRFWLNLTNSSGAFSQMAAGYMTDATDGVDIYDGKNINTGNVLLNSILNNEEYTIQGKSLPFNTADVIPLRYKITDAGDYTITLDHVDGLFTGGTQPIYLKDNLTSAIHDLNTGAYSFTSTAGTFSDRFEIVYALPLGTGSSTFTANNVIIYNYNNEFAINTGNTIMSSVKVFDIRGRLLQERKAINASQTTIGGGLANQVLLVQITSEDGVVVNKKVIR